MKWRQHHQPSPTCYLKVWLQKIEILDDGSDPTITSLTPYVWNASGKPCVDDLESYIDGEESEAVAPPATPGSVSVQIVAYSFVPDYDPTATTPHGPNGFP
jgi:hypothetical protein